MAYHVFEFLFSRAIIKKNGGYEHEKVVSSRFFVYAALIFCILSCSNEITETENATWQVLGNKGTGVIIADAVALALDANGLPVVGVQDSGNTSKATVIAYQDNSLNPFKISSMAFAGSSWALLGSQGFSDGQASFVQLRIGSDNNPIVAYSDSSYSNKAYVQKWSGSAWDQVGSKGFTSGGANNLSLALLSNNYPVVAYCDANDSYKPKVMQYTNGLTWSSIGSSPVFNGPASDVALVIDDADRPVVAYIEASTEKISVCRWNGSS